VFQEWIPVSGLHELHTLLSQRCRDHDCKQNSSNAELSGVGLGPDQGSGQVQVLCDPYWLNEQ